MGDTRTGSGVNSSCPSSPHSSLPFCTLPSHRNRMCGQQAQTHSLYPPDDYTAFKSNNLDSFCFSWCHSALWLIHLHLKKSTSPFLFPSLMPFTLFLHPLFLSALDELRSNTLNLLCAPLPTDGGGSL